MQIKRQARVPYESVIQWLTVGHPLAGILPSFDLSPTAKRHSYRIRERDWLAFLVRLRTPPRERQRSEPPPRPSPHSRNRGMFQY